jgi:biopolymer transport protein ExbD
VPRHHLIEDEPQTEINLSSMIDCIFILLIFFIVTTVFVDEKGLQVNKPDAAAATSLDETQNVVLEITRENKILMDGKEISLADVPTRVKASVAGGDTPVVIRADEHSAHGAFVSVWDAARRGGAVTLSFSTVN